MSSLLTCYKKWLLGKAEGSITLAIFVVNEFFNDIDKICMNLCEKGRYWMRFILNIPESNVLGLCASLFTVKCAIEQNFLPTS